MHGMGLSVLVVVACLVSITLATEEVLATRGVPTQQETNVFAVKLRDASKAEEVAAAHGCRSLGPVGALSNIFRFELLPNAKRGATQRLEEHHEVEFAERQVLRKRFKRELEAVHDPLWHQQWHLHGRSISINPQECWTRLNITGHSAQVAVVDDGLDHSHPDFAINYNPHGSYDINYNRPDPTPTRYDSHGTEAAGCAAAQANNNACGVGVAPNARVAGVRLIAKATTDADEAQGLSYARDVNQIMSSSWGPYDDGKRLEGPGRVLMAAFREGVEQGRQGKGTVFMWAGGNGRRATDNGNYDGYANNRYTIPIGAIVGDGEPAWYSEACACLYAVVPSSGGTTGGISTCTLQSQCASNFGGTSAAAPLAAGVVALMLDANPRLTWRDVMHVIAHSAIKVQPHDADWIVNGGGFNHNHNFGFGRIDALTTVNMSKHWTNVPAEAPPYTTARVEPNVAFNSAWVEASIDASAVPFDFVEHVDIVFRASHHYRGKVEVKLVSPHGTTSVLAQVHGDSNSDYPLAGWRFGSVRNWGENPKGTWKVLCRAGDGSPGVFNFAQLVLYGFQRPAQ